MRANRILATGFLYVLAAVVGFGIGGALRGLSPAEIVAALDIFGNSPVATPADPSRADSSRADPRHEPNAYPAPPPSEPSRSPIAEPGRVDAGMSAGTAGDRPPHLLRHSGDRAASGSGVPAPAGGTRDPADVTGAGDSGDVGDVGDAAEAPSRADADGATGNGTGDSGRHATQDEAAEPVEDPVDRPDDEGMPEDSAESSEDTGEAPEEAEPPEESAETSVTPSPEREDWYDDSSSGASPAYENDDATTGSE